jgi:retinol dehydrogenase-13
MVEFECKFNPVAVGFGVLALSGLGFGLFRYRKWVGGGVCYSKAKLTGKTVIITGANTGIGLETAVDLAKRGARVILGCRSVEKGEKTAVIVRQRSRNEDVIFIQLDLASLDSVRAAAELILQREPRIDILINNAGVSLPTYERTRDGFEAHFGVNHLGHFLFTNLLLPRIKESSSARIVTVSSLLYKKLLRFEFTDVNSSSPDRYSLKYPGAAYSQSKLANILFSRSLSKHLVGTGIGTYALCPGVIFRTNLSQKHLEYYPLYKRVSFEQTHKSPFSFLGSIKG